MRTNSLQVMALLLVSVDVKHPVAKLINKTILAFENVCQIYMCDIRNLQMFQYSEKMHYNHMICDIWKRTQIVVLTSRSTIAEQNKCPINNITRWAVSL